MLTEEQLAELGKRHKKVIRLEWEGHELVFRRPTTDEWIAYTRARDASGNYAAMRTNSQLTIVAYDGDMSPSARNSYTNVFLEEYPGFPNAPDAVLVWSVLAGTTREEELRHMGEACAAYPSRPKPTRSDSPNGSATAPADRASSPTTLAPSPS